MKNPPPFKMRTLLEFSRGDKMIMFFPCVLKEIFKKGRNYPWPKPERCPNCANYKVWGHGFVEAFFDGYNEPLVLRRYRCPVCGCVMRLRPSGYFKRFQASIKTIRSSIVSKVTTGRWLPGVMRTRQCHWFTSLLRKIKAYLSDTWDGGILGGFDTLMERGHIPVSRFI